MRGPRFLPAALLFLLPLQLFGNGGVFSLSAVQRTGNLVPIKKEGIFLDKENLKIRVEADDAFVEVSYDLHNRGGSDVVNFGFPVDVATPESLPAPNGYEFVLSNSLGDFRVVDGAQPVVVDRVVAEPLRSADRPPGLHPAIQITRRWSLMTLRFKPGEHKRVTVSYKVRAFAEDFGFSQPDLDWKFGLRTLFYTFRPAATWGNGRVRELVVTLDTSWLRERDLKTEQNAPKDASNDRGITQWAFRNKDLSSIEDLTVTYDPSAFYLDELFKKNLLPPENIKAVEISSSLPPDGSLSYAKEGMLDRDFRTAWVEGAKGPGIGESISIQPKNAYLERIGILNGYLTNELAYYANARIRKVRVELRLGEYADPNEQRVYDVTLPDRPYADPKCRYLLPRIDWIVERRQGNGFIDEAKLTIIEVYPGRQYDDTAITELYVGGFAVQR